MDALCEPKDLIASNNKINQVLQDDKFKKTFKIYMKNGTTNRRQLSQVQSSLERQMIVEDMMSVDRQEEDNLETVTEVSKAPSAVIMTKKNE